jgi:hypothetical protein
MTRLSRLTLVFSIAYAVMIMAPAMLSNQFGAYPLIKTGDVFDLLTPLILIPLYWLLFYNGGRAPTVRETVLFLVLAAVWVEGQGMHLSANSIGHVIENVQDANVLTLTHFYDEILSHYLWHFGAMALVALLIYRQRSYAGEPTEPRQVIAAAILYGLTFFISVVEAGTVPLGLPFVILVTLYGLIVGRNRLRQQPVFAFLFAAHLLALILLVGWGVYWRGFPQFSELGWIK